MKKFRPVIWWHQTFRKDFYISCFELQLGEFFSNISEVYFSINIYKLKPQFKVYYLRHSLCKESLEKIIKIFIGNLKRLKPFNIQVKVLSDNKKLL